MTSGTAKTTVDQAGLQDAPPETELFPNFSLAPGWVYAATIK